MRRELPPVPVDPDALLRSFVGQPVPAMPVEEVDELHDRIVPRLEAQRDRLARRRAARVRWLVFAAAACLPIAVWAGMWARGRGDGRRVSAAKVLELAGNAEVVRSGVSRALRASAEASLDPSEELQTGSDATARASLPTGAVVDVGPSSRVRFEPAGNIGHGSVRDRIELGVGKVEVEVPKLHDGDELSVHTEGVTVVVHGTKFSVERSLREDGRAETRVSVTAGKVAVYTEDAVRMLTAGATWVVGVAVEVPIEATASSGVPVSSAATAATLETSAAGARSTLAAENRLLAEAMRLRLQGDNERALARLDELIARHPRSPLADTARVERMRVLADLAEAGTRGP